MLPLVKSASNGFSRANAAHRFHTLLFDHFLQISVYFEMLAETISNTLSSSEPSKVLNAMAFHPQKPNQNEIHEKLNHAFMDFQRAFRDLCIPRLARPVWSTLALTSASKQDEYDATLSLYGRHPRFFQGYSEPSSPYSEQHDMMSDSFVRSCLCAHIAKSMSKDRC